MFRKTNSVLKNMYHSWRVSQNFNDYFHCCFCFFVFLAVLEYLLIVSIFIGFSELFSNKVKVSSPDVDRHGPTGYSDKKKIKSNQVV